MSARTEDDVRHFGRVHAPGFCGDCSSYRPASAQWCIESSAQICRCLEAWVGGSDMGPDRPDRAPPGPPEVPWWAGPVVAEVARARTLFPSCALLVTAFAEESGEVVKACLNLYHGKGNQNAIRTEIFQAMAMLVRLLEEGDPAHRVPPLAKGGS